MTYLRTHGNVVWLPDGRRGAGLIHRLTQTGSTLFASALRFVRKASRRASERATLARMSQRELRDLGLTHFDVEMELRKPFWRA